MYFELYSLDILELMENKKENIECVKEDTGISVEAQEIIKKKRSGIKKKTLRKAMWLIQEYQALVTCI